MATGTLSPSPWQTVENATGSPLVGAKVYTYIAGTTTLTATYSDAGLTVPNANPIITDSAGRYVAFLAPGAAYKFVVQDSTGAAIKTVDNITAVPASSANLDITGTAGEALTVGQAVYLSDGSGGKTAGQWYKADAANAYSSSAAVAVGMVPASISSAASGTIRLAGQMTGLSSLALGTTYYIGTAGAVTATQPTNSRIVGVADAVSSLVLNANPGIPNADNGVNDFRLTLTTGVPVTTADVTAATTIYCTPLKGNRIALPDSLGNVTIRTSAEFSIAVPATTNTLYDIFAYSNAGVPTLELLAWTNDTTRATAIVLTTTGFYTKSGDLTRRYLASVRTTAVSGQTEDSETKRYLYNQYNRVRKPLRRVYAVATTYNYTLATIRQTNADAANQVDIVVGTAEANVLVHVRSIVTNLGGSVGIGVGEDSTTTISLKSVGGTTNTTAYATLEAVLDLMPAVGRHFYSWNESSQAVNTSSWFVGNGSFVAGVNDGGMIGIWEC